MRQTSGTLPDSTLESELQKAFFDYINYPHKTGDDQAGGAVQAPGTRWCQNRPYPSQV